MLSKSGESKHPYLVLDLGGKTPSFPVDTMFAMGFSYMVFIMLRWFPSILVCSRFVFFVF